MHLVGGVEGGNELENIGVGRHYYEVGGRGRGEHWSSCDVCKS